MRSRFELLIALLPSSVDESTVPVHRFVFVGDDSARRMPAFAQRCQAGAQRDSDVFRNRRCPRRRLAQAPAASGGPGLAGCRRKRWAATIRCIVRRRCNAGTRAGMRVMARVASGTRPAAVRARARSFAGASRKVIRRRSHVESHHCSRRAVPCALYGQFQRRRGTAIHRRPAGLRPGLVLRRVDAAEGRLHARRALERRHVAVHERRARRAVQAESRRSTRRSSMATARSPRRVATRRRATRSPVSSSRTSST